MEGIIITALIGLVAGYVASRLQKGSGSGFIVNLILGLIGGVVGGWLFGLFGIEAYSLIGQIFTGIVGAVLILWVFSKLK